MIEEQVAPVFLQDEVAARRVEEIVGKKAKLRGKAVAFGPFVHPMVFCFGLAVPAVIAQVHQDKIVRQITVEGRPLLLGRAEIGTGRG